MTAYEEKELKEVCGGKFLTDIISLPKYRMHEWVKCLSAMDLGTAYIYDNKIEYSTKFHKETYFYLLCWPGRTDWIPEDDLTPSSDPWGK